MGERGDYCIKWIKASTERQVSHSYVKCKRVDLMDVETDAYHMLETIEEQEVWDKVDQQVRLRGKAFYSTAQ